MLSSLLGFLLLLPATLAAWEDGDPGIGNSGRNISTAPLPSNTTAACYALCLAAPACAAWEVRFASPSCAPAATCTLKSNFGGDGADGFLGARVPCFYDPCVASGPVSRPGQPLLQPLAFTPAPLASVAPAGWLAAQLAVQAATGQAGQLALFWGPVADSAWRGAPHNADGYLHEDFPYTLNGITPHASLLTTGKLPDPTNLTGQVQQMVDEVLAGQADSGWLGPDDTKSGDEYWARFNVLSALVQHGEAHPSQRATLVRAALRYVVEATRRQLSSPYQINDWSAARAHDYVLTLHGLLDSFDSLAAMGAIPPGVSQATLYNAAAVAHAQALGNGAVWEAYFASPGFPRGAVTEDFGMLTHGVNVAQAIKTAGVWWRQQRANASQLVDSTVQRLEVLRAYHGSPSGVVQADEHLAGPQPQRGTEMCGIVEAMYSFEVLGDSAYFHFPRAAPGAPLHLLSAPSFTRKHTHSLSNTHTHTHATTVLGDPSYFDRAERAAFNALPASATKDGSAHNYLSQANEVVAEVSNPHVWATDGPYATIYGLSPNFVCCTANHVQGWPKFAARLHKTTPDGGVAVTLWAPGATSLALQGSGAPASVAVSTSYPFGDSALVTVAAPVGTPVRLRVPGWATAATLSVNGGSPLKLANGTFHLVPQPTATATYSVDFAPEVRVEAYFAGSLAVYRGALLYALEVGEAVSQIAQNGHGFNDYKVLNTTAWNVALEVDPASPGAALAFTRLSAPGASPFATVTQALSGKGRLLPGWVLFNNSAAAPPQSPVDCGAGACGAEVAVRLIPYGQTLLRVASMPWVMAQ